MKLGIAIALVLPLYAQVTYDRLLNSTAEPDNWLTYSGNYAGHRYSPLSSIHEGNVATLRPIWVYQTSSLQKFETTPLVVDGIMYISEPPSHVTALDTRTGRPLWKYRRTLPEDLRVCCGQVNRGVAILGDLVYVGTVDAYLVALHAKSGAVMWETKVANYQDGYSLTGAPLAVKDKSSSGWREASTEYEASWMPTMRRPANEHSVSGQSRAREKKGMKRGKEIAGKRVRLPPGLPAHTIRERICFTGAQEIRAPTGMATYAKAIIFTPIP